MNNQYTEIAFVLDRSGSMAAMHDIAVEGYNRFLSDQKSDEQEVRLSLLLFDHEYTPLYESVPVAELTPLTMDDFQPRGSTALLDALGRTIDDLGKRLAVMPEPDRPDHVIVAIMTDGMENASERYSLSDVHKRISHQQEEYDWEFLFMSSDLSAVDLARRAGIEVQRAIVFPKTREGNREAFETSADCVREMKESRRSKRKE